MSADFEKMLRENIPDGYALLAMPEEDLVDLVLALAAAEAMFLQTNTSATPAGLTVAKVRRLRGLLIRTAEAPDLSMTKLDEPSKPPSGMVH